MRHELSERQQECLQALLDLDGNYERVADDLRIEVSTIRTHIHLIYDKWQVHTLVAAIKKGLMNGTLELR